MSIVLIAPAGASLHPTHATAAGLYATAAPDEADPNLQQAQALYNEGKARFETFDYEGAVDLWTKAYAKLPDHAAGIRNSMAYNIATAQEKAFELDHDVQHLRQAILILESYIENYKALYQGTEEAQVEIDKAEYRIAVLKERIEHRDDDSSADGPPSSPPNMGDAPTSAIEWNNEHILPPDPELLARNKQLAQESKKTDAMLIASYITLSVGGLITLAGLGTIAGGNAADAADDVGQMGENETPDDASESGSGQTVARAGYGVLAFGLTFIVTGATLLGVGLHRRKKARTGTLMSGSPLLGPTFAGASLRLRF